MGRKRRRSAVAVAATVLAVALTVGASGAGWLTWGTAGSRATPAVSVSTWRGGDRTALGADVRAHAEAVYEAFSGTVRQRDAVALVRAYRGNRAVDRCMAAAGHPKWNPLLNLVGASREDPLKTNVWLAEPMTRWRSHDLVAERSFLTAEKVMNADHDPDYDADAVGCSTAGGPHRSGSYGDHALSAAEHLQGQWWAAMGRLDEQTLPSPDRYARCVKAAHTAILAPYHPRSYGELSEDVAYGMSHASSPDHTIPQDVNDPQQWADPQWQAFLVDETAFDRADWRCRAGVYRRHVSDVTSLVDTFARAHARQIAALRAFWRQAPSRAARLPAVDRP